LEQITDEMSELPCEDFFKSSPRAAIGAGFACRRRVFQMLHAPEHSGFEKAWML